VHGHSFLHRCYYSLLVLGIQSCSCSARLPTPSLSHTHTLQLHVRSVGTRTRNGSEWVGAPGRRKEGGRQGDEESQLRLRGGWRWIHPWGRSRVEDDDEQLVLPAEVTTTQRLPPSPPPPPSLPPCPASRNCLPLLPLRPQQRATGSEFLSSPLLSSPRLCSTSPLSSPAPALRALVPLPV
jgi:hypothetical protein